eukprot:TRINITY_DN830_c0_g3_i1.p3 TRINITY_DN830_c0_g3~~TRINITY_DN830_c0_g3_i1.p3  ORF type:complete len:282 (-),score=82.18 TRINITY_DN830_c0_g3_i1:310-1155(-)
MLFSAVVLALLSVANTQSVLDLQALAATDLASAASAAMGSGASVVGDIIAAADDNTAYSSAVVTATGAGPVVVPTVPVVPKPVDPIVDIVKPKPYKKFFPQYYSCEDLKDDKCYDVDDYYKCGFCYAPKTYPVKGYACKYYEQVKTVKKDSKKYDYETEYVPYCECEGIFVHKGKYCPSCDMLLADLLECAGYEDIPEGAIEIPASCLEEIDVDEEYLESCDYFGKKDPYTKKGDKPVYYDPKYLYVQPKYDFVEAFAQAKASAVASGGGVAQAIATAFGN